MNRLDLVNTLAQRAELSKKDAAKYVNVLLGVIADDLTDGDGEVAIPDFGRFYVKHVGARKGKNPATGEEITIEEHDRIVFKPSENISIFSRKHN